MVPPARDPQAARQAQLQQQKKGGALQGVQPTPPGGQPPDSGAALPPSQQSQADGGAMDLGGSQHGNPHRSGATLMLGNFEGHAKKFLDPETNMQMKLTLVTEIRDSIEIVHTSEYQNFLKHCFKALQTGLLSLTQPQATDTVEHKVRNIILEVLNRMPHSETLKPYVVDLMKLSMHVAATDNEENALIALRIIFDLHKNYRPNLEDEVQPFLDFVVKIYQNFKETVLYFFQDGAGPDAPGGVPSSPRGPPLGQLNPSVRSFKVVTECPLIVMFLFQLYPRFLGVNIPTLLPLMVTTISIPGPNNVPPHLKQTFSDLKAAQVKTVSFMTYLLRSFSDDIRPYTENVSKSIVNLLVTCPDSIATRKELLVATRHVLATDFRKGFFTHIDILLDERVLVGTGRSCYETLRPLAYSLLAELIHHVRIDLSLQQLSRIIYLFSKNVHDHSLPLSVQTTCVRLMLNLVETIFSRRMDERNKEEGRQLLRRILDCFVSKFGTLRRAIPYLLPPPGSKKGGPEKPEEVLKDSDAEGEEKPTLRSRLELPVQKAALNLITPMEHAKELADCKYLTRTLIQGMKTLLWSITNFNRTAQPQQIGPGPPQMNPNGPKGMREDEVRLIAGLLKSGVYCLALFKEKNEEENLLHFAGVFSVMAERNFMDLFSMCMPRLFDVMVDSIQLVTVFAALLQNAQISRTFADVLAHYLVTNKLDLLKQPDLPQAKLLLQLLRLLFSAVAKYPAECESVMRPHVLTLMETCMKNATELDKPIGYMQLLRIMFRALSGGKFAALYQEFIGTLQPCLNALLSMLDGPSGQDMRDLLVELCLTLPARLSALLPHLPRLMKPLVLALKGSDDLVALGLRTLEFWVDSLNPEFLEPSMASVMTELILTLWGHLRPKPYPFGAKSLQLLGKLGGRNRRFLKEMLELEYKENPEHGLRMILTFETQTSFLVPLDRCIHLARTAVQSPPPGMELHCRKSALTFLKVCLGGVANLNGNIGGEGVGIGQLSGVLLTHVDPALRRPEKEQLKVDLGVKTKTQLLAERTVFKQLLMAVIAASAEPDLSDPDDEFVANLCRHFAMLFTAEPPSPPGGRGAPREMPSAAPPPGKRGAKQEGLGPAAQSIMASANLKELDPVLFLDALVAVLADENREQAKAALQGLHVFCETLLLLAKVKRSGISPQKASLPSTPMIVSSPSVNPVVSPPATVKIPVFEHLIPRLLHCCYGGTWQSQMGGVQGIGALVGKAPVDTLCQFQVKTVRALLYVLKQLPVTANKEQEETSLVLTQVLRVVNPAVDASTSDAQDKQSFQGVVEVLAAELFNPAASQNVRKNVQTCLGFLAKRWGTEVSELLEPLHGPLLNMLVGRPLRAKHAEAQVGTVMALNFCLALRPPLLKVTPELLMILQEALGIAETDEQAMHGKYLNPKTTATLTKLRTACIELLCTAMAWADLKHAQHTELRTRIIGMFFKRLTCQNQDIVAVAKEGLRQVIRDQKMPKELLQTSLRPILVNLAHYKNLNMPLLQGLARLLELLANWFNVTLGEKLMEHLKKWLELDKLIATTGKGWKNGDEPKIAAAVLELFHLLPPAAAKFLDPMVCLTIQLEKALPPTGVYSELNSPYRLPLTKFLNRYSTDAVDYFLQRLNQPAFFTRLLDIIRSEAGEPLRNELAKSPEKIIAKAFPNLQMPASPPPDPQNPAAPAAPPLNPHQPPNTQMLTQNQHVNPGQTQNPNPTPGTPPATPGTPSVAIVVPQQYLGAPGEVQFQGVALVSALVKLLPNWLHENRPMFDALVQLWRSPQRAGRIRQEEKLNVPQAKESKRLIKCFLNFVRHERSEVNVLFDMLSIFLTPTRIDYTFLKAFFMIEVPEQYTPPEKKAVLLRFLDLFRQKALSQELLVVAMQLLILPMLTYAFTHGEANDVIEEATIGIIVEHLLDPPAEISETFEEPLRIELLQLATALISHMPRELNPHRKELIKHGWHHLKREDSSSSKQWAFVNVCHFLQAYQAPEKIILQVFVALLRTCQPESRQLVKQALDTLLPSLPVRLPLKVGDSKVPIWIRYTKKVLVEEGHSMAHLTHIFQLLVRHSSLFYPSRAQFVPQMVNSLSRLGLPQNTPPESRKLAIDLAGLVVQWEKRRMEEAENPPPPPPQIPGGAQNPEGVLDMDVDHPGSGSKRTSSGAGFDDDEKDGVKRLKGEGGAPIATPVDGGIPPTPGANAGTPTGPPEEEFRPSPAMEEMIISFLTRVCFLTEPSKDKEHKVMYTPSLDLLGQCLDLWPTATVKFHYMEKLLSAPNNRGLEVPPALNTGLDVLKVVLAKQARQFLKSGNMQIHQVLDPCFAIRNSELTAKLCSVLEMVYQAYPTDTLSLPPEVKSIHTKVEDMLIKQLTNASNQPTNPAVELKTLHTGLTVSLQILKVLSPLQKSFVDKFVPALVRIGQRFLKLMIDGAGLPNPKTSHPQDPQAVLQYNLVQAAKTAGELPPWGNLKLALRLASLRVLGIPQQRIVFLQMLPTILAEPAVDPSVRMEVLDVVKEWVEKPDSKASGNLKQPDVLMLMTKLAQVDKANFGKELAGEWDGKLLKLLHRLCADVTHHSPGLRQEVFQKVERTFMLGLRCSEPGLRQQFFALYNEAIGKTLFARLCYIISEQDWEALADVFWLKQGLDILLAILVEKGPIEVAPNSARVPALMVVGSLPEKPVPVDTPMRAPEAVEQTDESAGGAEGEKEMTFYGLLTKHAKFLNDVAKLQVSDLILPLRELAHYDSQVAYHMWVLIFPIVWATLQQSEQVQLAKPMIALLSKQYHTKQLDRRPNVVQALLEGISLSQPQPKFPSELIKFLGKTYNAWHIAIPLLESHVMLFPGESRCFDALGELYRLLNEEDVLYGLWKRRALTAETKAGLSLVQHGMWQRAQEVFYRGMTRSAQGGFDATVLKAEMCLWEEQWISSAKRLNQWELLADFGRSVENYDILMDTLWKLPDWPALKDNVLPKAQVEETPRLRMVQAYVALHEGSMSSLHEADVRCAQGMELALQRWWQLPELGVQNHIPLLQQFQQLVELQESAKVLVEINQSSKQQAALQQAQAAGQAVPPAAGPQYVELKDTLETWRLRVPNEWDDLTVWNDLLQWRNHMYNTIINAFKHFQETNPQLHQLGFRDKAWSVNKLAYVARKQGLGEVCVNVLNKLYGFMTMEVQEAFVKIREQAKAYLDMKGELRTGMNTINTTNLEYFPVQHKAEIFRLKGEFLMRMGDGDNANQAFSTAISLFKHLPKGWVSWGNYCDKVYRETGEQLWLEYAVSCYLQGVKYGSADGRNHLARVLYLLSFDNQEGTVGKAFDKYGDNIPHWVWLSWVPQLLLALQRPEAQHCKAVLIKLASVFPQAVYYSLRCFLLERREMANSVKNTGVPQRGGLGSHTGQGSDGNLNYQSPGTQGPDQSSQPGPGLGNRSGSGSVVKQEDDGVSGHGDASQGALSVQGGESSQGGPDAAAPPKGSLAYAAKAAFDLAKEVMEKLRLAHQNLATELEVMLTEIGSRFVPLPEERLLAVVHALLHRCYKFPTATTSEVPKHLKNELSGVCRACFSMDTVNKHNDFVQEYKQEFENDLNPDSRNFPATLAELTEKLKAWKTILQRNVEERLPSVMKLEEESRALREFHVLDVEVPGQYLNDQEIAPDHTVKLDRIGADVPVVRRHGTTHRRLTMIGSDGSVKQFLVQTSLTLSARSDERMVQLFRVLNRLLDKHKESRRRHLAFHAPIICPVWPQVRLVEDERSFNTFGEVYEISCARYGREADLPITFFKEQLNQAIAGTMTQEAIMELRLKTYESITKNHVSENVFSQFMYKTLPTCNHLWTFKKQFAAQLALSSFMSYMLHIGARSPNKTLFATNTGKIFQNDFHPTYNDNGLVECKEPVPFRLTRNLQTFFTSFGVEGLFVASMCAAAQATVAPQFSIESQLAMFFRDELTSWSYKRVPAPPATGTLQLTTGELKQKVGMNVDHVLARVKAIAPQTYAEEGEGTEQVPLSVQRGVTELVAEASMPTHLCMMDPTWHPWF